MLSFRSCVFIGFEPQVLFYKITLEHFMRVKSIKKHIEDHLVSERQAMQSHFFNFHGVVLGIVYLKWH